MGLCSRDALDEKYFMLRLTGRRRKNRVCTIWQIKCEDNFFFVLWRCGRARVMASTFLMFLDHTQRRTTVGRTPLDELSALRRDLYLTTHNTHNRQISMPPLGFEPTISAGERPQTYALDRAATVTGTVNNCRCKIMARELWFINTNEQYLW